MSKVVVIGSGLGGLTCAYILQKNGYEVTVLEQGFQVGGCLQCFVRDGVKFETGMHFIGSAAPGQTINRAMEYFSLSRDVSLSSLDTSAYNTVDFAGEKFEFANGREAFLEKMSGYFPSQKRSLRKYLDIVDDIAAASSIRSLTSASRDVTMNTEYQTRSINDVLSSLFDDQLLRNVLVGDLPLYCARLDRTPFALHAFIMDFYNRSAYRVVGGSDAIALSLASSIRLMGGKVATRKKAVKIQCDDVRAVGVETSDCDFFPADYVISAVHPKRMLEMLDTKLIRPAFRERISSIPQTSSVFALYVKFKEGRMPYMNTNYFAYDGHSPWNCENYTDGSWPGAFLYMHMCHADNARWARSAVVLAYMNMSEVSRWAGTSVGRRGKDYEEFKRVHAQRLIGAVEKRHSGFASSIESYTTSTPLTYLDYTGTEDGSMYGVAKDISLGPAGRVPYRTRIPNLFLAGQNVNSHGMLGVIVGTIVTCSELVPARTICSQMFDRNL